MQHSLVGQKGILSTFFTDNKQGVKHGKIYPFDRGTKFETNNAEGVGCFLSLVGDMLQSKKSNDRVQQANNLIAN